MLHLSFKNTSAAEACYVLFSKLGQILINTHCMLEHVSGTTVKLKIHSNLYITEKKKSQQLKYINTNLYN
jgi:hypothetical protein